jgi:hypothetical protein
MGLSMDEMNRKLSPAVNLEDFKHKSLPPNVDGEKLNQPLSIITRADDNKRNRSRHEE